MDSKINIGDIVYHHHFGKCKIISINKDLITFDSDMGRKIGIKHLVKFQKTPILNHIESIDKIYIPKTTVVYKKGLSNEQRTRLDLEEELEELQNIAYENHEYPEPWLGFNADMTSY